MHAGGEVDIRGVYCALSIARLTNVYTEDMFRGTELWVVRSVQTQQQTSVVETEPLFKWAKSYFIVSCTVTMFG